MKISFNIQYNAPAKPAPNTDFEHSFDKAIQTRKSLALIATQAAMRGASDEDKLNIPMIRGSVREALNSAGLPDEQIQKVLTFVPFALATSLNKKPSKALVLA